MQYNENIPCSCDKNLRSYAISLWFVMFQVDWKLFFPNPGP